MTTAQTQVKKRTEELFTLIRDGKPITTREEIELVFRLSIPAILTQISFIAMQYIDAAMLGHLGAKPAAAVALVATTIWLFWGTISALTAGFTVQVAQRIGAKEFDVARSIFRQCLAVEFCFGAVLGVIGFILSPYIPKWLGGEPELWADASLYFKCFASGIPLMLIAFISSSMLRSTGNVKLPSILNITMCFLDVIFNLLLIFPTATYNVLGFEITVPGANWGVAGAMWGTILAETVCGVILFYFLAIKNDKIALAGHPGSYRPTQSCMRRLVRISTPLAGERVAMTGAQICTTIIVAPLGVFALAAHSFSITAEALCYMPGYGIADAASTLVGQSVGAKRPELAKKIAWINIAMAVVIMAFMGVVMYIFAPGLIGIMTENPEIVALGASALRIEAFAEPFFAAAIVSYGILIACGYAFVPSTINFSCMWLVRLPLAYLLAKQWGLDGVWTAMAIELVVRGLIFTFRVKTFNWSRRRAIED